jgi:hypothetical protein
MSIILRPYRSPRAPKYRTDAASPSEYPTAIRLRLVCDASKAAPIDGSATLATARFKFATAATRISAMSAAPALSGWVDASVGVVGAASAMERPPRPQRRGTRDIVTAQPRFGNSGRGGGQPSVRP